MPARESSTGSCHAPGPVVLTVHPRVPRDWPASGLGEIEVLSRELPHPDSLPEHGWIAVSPGRTPAPSLWARLSHRPTPSVHLAVRATALLLAGYANVCADESGTAYGQVPAR